MGERHDVTDVTGKVEAAERPRARARSRAAPARDVPVVVRPVGRDDEEVQQDVVGEVLDVDGITGGHNFQNCWTTSKLVVASLKSAKAQHELGPSPRRDLHWGKTN